MPDPHTLQNLGTGSNPHAVFDDDGTIASATFGERDMKTTKTVGFRYGLAQKIRAFYACGTVIEVDEHSVVTSIGDY